MSERAAVEASTTSALGASLEDFARRVNEHPRMKTLLKGWDRQIVVRAEDTGAAYTMTVEECRVVRVSEGGDGSAPIHLKAADRVLVDIFLGVLSPAAEYVEGRLQVTASDKDQIKLDALSLVLWD